MTLELEKLVNETLINSHYSHLICDHVFLAYLMTINNIYPIKSHQIIAKCAVDYTVQKDNISLCQAVGRI